jgi:hypothetical protein
MAYSNPNLHDAAKSYVIAAINLIRERVRADLEHSILDEQTFFFTRLATSDELRELSEYKHCAQILRTDETFARQMKVLVGPRGGPRSQSPDVDGVMWRLLDLGLRTGQCTFDEAHFEREYGNLEKAYYSSEIDYEAIAPLNGFVASGPIQLSNEIEIIELRAEDIGSTNVITSESSDDSWTQKLYGVRIRYSLPKVIGDAHMAPQHRQRDRALQSTVNEKVSEVLSALRLCGIESVYVPGVLHKTSTWSFGQSLPFPGKFQPEIQFSMSVDEPWLQRLADFWNTLQTEHVTKHKYLVNAIRRFGYAYERHRIEDKIVDLLISAEALFLSSDSYTGEVKYRLSLRASLFLATEGDVRQAIFDRMKAAYDLRSAVVHGAAYNTRRLPKNRMVRNPH